MITYREIASKEDRNFHRVARKVIGSEYTVAIDEANDAFTKGYQSGTLNTRDNDARRAANLVILKWLRDYGISNWKDIDAPQVKRKSSQSARGDFVSDIVKKRKYVGETGLWSKKI